MLADGEYLGVFTCDTCTADGPAPNAPVWCYGGARLCRQHYTQAAGQPPRPPRTADDLPPEPLPAADTWQRLAPGLRARRVPAGVEIQSVRNVAGMPEPVSQSSWTISETALIELVLLASAYHDDATATQAMARVHLARFLHGADRP